MSELEEKLGSILNNPQLMQQILSMAQTIGKGQTPPEEAEPKQPKAPAMPNIDPHFLHSLTGIVQGSSMDQNQQNLIHALSPYLSQNRINKLERAMRAARMAGAASTFLNSGGLQMLTGR